MASTSQPVRREILNIRIPATERSLIDRAAHSTGKTRTDFIREAARSAAEEALVGRVMLSVTPKAYAEFLQRLDAKPKANARLRRTMRGAKPWK